MPSAPAADPRLARLADDLVRFRAFVARRVRDQHLVDEVLQDSFLRAAAGIGGLRAGDRLDAWFFRILRNRISDLGQARPAASGGDPDLLPSTEPDLVQVCGCLRGLLDRLSTDHAEVLRRLDLEGDAPAMMAGELGLTVNALNVRRHRARAALRQLLITACGACAGEACRDCICAPRR